MSENARRNIEIHSKFDDLIITPLICAAYAIEFTKLLIFDKLQIPYPYSWLKSCVNKRKECSDNKQMLTASELQQQIEQEPRPPSYQHSAVDRQYKIASKAYETLEDLFRNVQNEFKRSTVQKVLIAFGANASLAKEVYVLNMPKITDDHINGNHVNDVIRIVNKMLRVPRLSQEWLDFVTGKTLPLTNMHLLLFKSHSTEQTNNADHFVPVDFFRIPSSAMCVNLSCDNKMTKVTECCSNLNVFNDDNCRTENDVKNDPIKADSLDGIGNDCREYEWYESTITFHGFKNSLINGQLACNLW